MFEHVVTEEDGPECARIGAVADEKHDFAAVPTIESDDCPIFVRDRNGNGDLFRNADEFPGKSGMYRENVGRTQKVARHDSDGEIGV